MRLVHSGRQQGKRTRQARYLWWEYLRDDRQFERAHLALCLLRLGECP